MSPSRISTCGVRWNDYEKKYAETFRTLREDDHFADVTLACEGHAVKAHRIILCACSGYFSHILRTIHPTQHPVLLLSDVSLYREVFPSPVDGRGVCQVGLMVEID